jgi:hypothetical protein
MPLKRVAPRANLANVRLSAKGLSRTATNRCSFRLTDQPRVEAKSKPLLISGERLEVARCPVVFGGERCPMPGRQSWDGKERRLQTMQDVAWAGVTNALAKRVLGPDYSLAV